MRLSHTKTVNPNIVSVVYTPHDSFKVLNRWTSSVRGRLGYAVKNWLIYGTGGVAFANIKARANFIQTVIGGTIFPATAGSATHSLTGGTIGLGAEYAYTDNWSVGAEYRYTTYGKRSFEVGQVETLSTVFTTVTTKVRLDTNEVYFKFNYNFG